MRLELTRRWKTADTTTGTLTIDGVPECFTLEDAVRLPAGATADDIARLKVAGETAIPPGDYRLVPHKSDKFGRVAMLEDVPGFTYVYIHAGNSAGDTKGCILVGLTRRPTALEQSRIALDALMAKIEAAWAAGDEVRLVIREMFV